MTVILRGWKEIASYLGTGIRTAQRWEGQGLPIRRPIKGPRSPVHADSGQLDSWRRDTAFWQNRDFTLLSLIERTRTLREEVKQARATLKLKMQALKNEVAVIQKRRDERLAKQGKAQSRHNSRLVV